MINSRLKLARRRRRDLHKTSKSVAHRIVLFKSSKHMYASICDETRVLGQISTLSKEAIESKMTNVNIKTCTWIGVKASEFLKSINVKQVFFNKSGYKFHGRIKAIADGLKQGGILC